VTSPQDAAFAPLLAIRCAVVIVVLVLLGRKATSKGRRLRESWLGSALFSLLITIPFGVVVVLWSTEYLGRYGLGLFVALPTVMSALPAVVLDSRFPLTLRSAFSLALFTQLIFASILLAFAVEGVVCLMMAVPLGIVFAALGGGLGYLLRCLLRRRSSRAMATGLLILLPPGAIEAEHLAPPPPPLYWVSTSMDIEAPPHVVWAATIAPSKLTRPSSLPFRFGVAYPRGSWIEGTGTQAVRYCDFSTGLLVEPVLEWREPELLRFRVASNPRPMEEWTPLEAIYPRHLDGFLVAREGIFRLSPIEGGTRLEAATLYQHGLWPTDYWRWWSDAIIHRVHNVVLAHIREASLAPLRPAIAPRPEQSPRPTGS
jgi:hypothetical protein